MNYRELFAPQFKTNHSTSYFMIFYGLFKDESEHFQIEKMVVEREHPQFHYLDNMEFVKMVGSIPCFRQKQA